MISIWSAFLLDLLIGDPYGFPHPVRFIGKYIQFFENKIRKYINSPNQMRMAGIALTITTVLLAYGLTFGLLFFAQKIHIWFYWIVNVIILWTCIALKCLGKEGMKVYNALMSGDLDLARKQVSYLVARDTQRLDERGVARAAVETVVENTSDGIIAPLFYMLIGGAPLAMAYKAINTLDSMVGYKNEKYKDFGWASAKVDDIANFIPARITGLVIVMGACFWGMDYKAGWYVMKRDHNNHSSPNAGYPEAAAAGVMSIQLGGTNCYFGENVYKPMIGTNIRLVDKEDIIKSIHLMYTASVIILIFGSIVRDFVRI